MTDDSDGAPVDILLIEDNPGDVRLIQEAFKAGRVDSTLHVVTDGERALDFLHRRGEYAEAPRPDLVLLDLNLPRIDGREVLADIEADPALRVVPVIVLTSSRADTDVVESYALRANAYLIKPIDPDELFALVRTLEAFWLCLVTLPPRS